MGARGPTSTKAQQMKPTSKIKDGTPPLFLDPVASAEWVRLVAELKTLSTIDTTVLALHCTAYSDWLRHGAALAATGDTYTTSAGLVKVHPSYDMKKQAALQLLKTANELGFTPNARVRMNVQAATEKTDKKTLADEINGS